MKFRHFLNAKIPEKNIVTPIELLLDEIQRPEGADTRIWLTVEGIKLYIPRQHIIDIIKGGKTLVNLDATPNLLLNLLFPQTKFVNYDAKEHVKVTQVTNSLYTKSNIAARNYMNLHKINDALENVTQNATLPVIFCHKAFDPHCNPDKAEVFSVSNPNALYGHFDYETRAVNGYSDADVLCIVGHYSKPISHLRSLAQAVRNCDKVVEKNCPKEILRPYWYRKGDGGGIGRWCKADEDFLVQQLIIQSEYSIYIQAIGRGRAALRSAENPLIVYLITATPIDSLPIEKLVRLSDLTKRKPDKQKFYARRDELNAEKKQSAYRKIEAAIRHLLKEGKEITLDAIEKLSGVKRTLIARLRKVILNKIQSSSNVAIDTCDNFESNLDIAQIDNDKISDKQFPLDSALAAWAKKYYGPFLGEIIRASEEGFSLEEPMKIRDGVIVEDFCGFVIKKFTKLKELDFRLPRLRGAVLEYANKMRVECIRDLYALRDAVSQLGYFPLWGRE